MKFTPEQVIEMALEADGGFSADHINIDSLTRLCTLAADRALEAAAASLPTNWLDPMLTGPKAVKERFADCRDVEAVLHGCTARIRAMKEQQ